MRKGNNMFLYKELAHEWDGLNALSKEEVSVLEETIEDGVFQGCNLLTNQLMNQFTHAFPEVNNLAHAEINKIKEGISNALFSGYLIYVAYQRVANIRRPKMRQGISYIPTLINEYNNIIAPFEKNSKHLTFYYLLDEEPALELLMEKVASIEMNILRKNYPHVEDIPFQIGYAIRELLGRGVFTGFGIGYAENSLRS